MDTREVGVLKVLAKRLRKGNLTKSEQPIPQNVLRFSRRASRRENNRKQWKEVNPETQKGTDWLTKQHWKTSFTNGNNVPLNIEIYRYSLNCIYSCWTWNVPVSGTQVMCHCDWEPATTLVSHSTQTAKQRSAGTRDEPMQGTEKRRCNTTEYCCAEEAGRSGGGYDTAEYWTGWEEGCRARRGCRNNRVMNKVNTRVREVKTSLL